MQQINKIEPQDLLKCFSDVVREQREKLGISQEELGVRAGLHRTYISDVECGARNLSLKTLCRLAVALELPPSGLIRFAEHKVMPELHLLQDPFDGAPCGFHTTNAEGTIVRMNDTELDWLGYRSDELLGIKNFRDILSSESRVRFEGLMPVLMDRGIVEQVEYDFIAKNGGVIPVTLNVNVVLDDRGNCLLSRASVFKDARRQIAPEYHTV